VRLQRRNFLKSTASAVAGLAVSPPLARCLPSDRDSGAVNSDQLKASSPVPLGRREELLMPHAIFRELQLGTVRPAGWLEQELLKQVTNLTIPQNNFCFPFDRRYWASNERSQAEESRNGGTHWYPWEQMGYWTDGAYRSAAILNHEHLKRRAKEPISYTINNPIDGWFLGSRWLYDPPVDPDSDQDPGRWPAAVFFRALAAAAEAESDSRILDAMCQHYVRDNRSDYQHGPFGPRDRVNIESMLWCYAHSGDPRLLEKAKSIWAGVSEKELADLGSDQPSDMHGVTFAEVSKLAALISMYTGERRQLEVSISAMQRVFKYHMLADGTPSAAESLSGTSALDGHETCDIVEFNLSWGYLLMATGEGGYGDHIERALFNAGMGAVRKDWSGVQYISCPNQLHIARNSCQVGHVNTAAALYGPNSDHRPRFNFVTACCAGNINRMLPTYVQRMWMRSADYGLAATLYGPCQVKTVVEGALVEIVEDTSYPFSDNIKLRIVSDRRANFPLYLRIPSWCKTPEITVNEHPYQSFRIENGFAVIRGVHFHRDTITLKLPMKAAVGHSSDGGIWVERGPLVYALQPEEKWEAHMMPEFEITSPDYFPMWAASANSSWNYGLAINEGAPLDGQVLATTNPTVDPWSIPGSWLRVSARRILDWDLRRTGADNDSLQTPPLPRSTSKLGKLEQIRLVPLGCTHLRLTVFPHLRT
jgi:hypothetical protein